jgi:predicted 2-oxoglutarate/Fe(II)-dependent dioxygenase YbiX
MFDLVKKSDAVWVFENVFDKNQELLDSILLKDWKTYNNDGGGSTLIGRSTWINKTEDYYEDILNIFSECLAKYSEEMFTWMTPDRLGSGRWLVREYQAGSFMTAHEDAYSYVKENGEEVRPKITIIYYINDDFEGGHIEFPYEDQGLIIKPKANSVLIFPSSFVHGVLPVTSGNRYMTQTYAYRHPLSHYDAQ